MDFTKEIAACLSAEGAMQQTHDALWDIYVQNPSEEMETIIQAHASVRQLLARHRHWFEIRQPSEKANG